MMRNEPRGTGLSWLDNGWVAEGNDGTLRQSEAMLEYKEPGRRFQGRPLALLLSLLSIATCGGITVESRRTVQKRSWN